MPKTNSLGVAAALVEVVELGAVAALVDEAGAAVVDEAGAALVVVPFSPQAARSAPTSTSMQNNTQQVMTRRDRDPGIVCNTSQFLL